MSVAQLSGDIAAMDRAHGERMREILASAMHPDEKSAQARAAIDDYLRTNEATMRRLYEASGKGHLLPNAGGEDT